MWRVEEDNNKPIISYQSNPESGEGDAAVTKREGDLRNSLKLLTTRNIVARHKLKPCRKL